MWRATVEVPHEFLSQPDSAGSVQSSDGKNWLFFPTGSCPCRTFIVPVLSVAERFESLLRVSQHGTAAFHMSDKYTEETLLFSALVLVHFADTNSRLS